MNTKAIFKDDPENMPPPEIPESIKQWNWGAFLLSWIWSLGNGVPLGLLALIPGVNIIMMFVLGFKGNLWAWKSCEPKNEYDFHSTQKKWVIAGLIGWTLMFIKIFL